jgi:hypothetical protein
MYSTTFCDVSLCNLVRVSWCFREMCHLHLQSLRPCTTLLLADCMTGLVFNPEDGGSMFLQNISTSARLHNMTFQKRVRALQYKGRWTMRPQETKQNYWNCSITKPLLCSLCGHIMQKFLCLVLQSVHNSKLDPRLIFFQTEVYIIWMDTMNTKHALQHRKPTSYTCIYSPKLFGRPEWRGIWVVGICVGHKWVSNLHSTKLIESVITDFYTKFKAGCCL